MIRKISDSVRYIGVDDTGLDLFENQYAVPQGISYNSYLILDEKTAILDTCDARASQEWKQNLRGALDGRTPDYLIIHHLEPDHSAMIDWVLGQYPDVQVVCSAMALKMLPQFFEGLDPAGRCIVAAEGSTLDLGRHKLRFIMAPMVHWPEVMMSFDCTEKILFSADAFGKFGAVELTGGLHCTSNSDWMPEARRYYFNICGKYGAQVQKALSAAGKLSPETICPLHGPVLSATVGEAMRLYDLWSSYKVESEGVFIAYASIHDGTAAAAEKLAELLRGRGAKEVVIADLSRFDVSRAVENAFRYGTTVFAAASYDAGLFPPMYNFIWHLQIKCWQSRRAAVIENGSWVPSAGRVMTEMLSAMKGIELVGEKVTIRSRMHSTDIPSLERLADALIAAQ